MRVVIALMRILLHNGITRRFYAGGEAWTEDVSRAVDFRTVKNLEEHARRKRLGPVEIIFSYEQPRCDLRVPLQMGN